VATASITDSLFTFNVAHAGSECTGSLSAVGVGGTINNTGSLTVTGSKFSQNQAIGGNNSSGTVRPGLGAGGAVTSGGPSGPAAVLVISDSTFDHNQAIGGNGNRSTTNPAPSVLGPNDAFGGGFGVSGGTATITGCTVEHNSAIAGAGGSGQNGGLALGGGFNASNFFGLGVSVTVSNSTIDHNRAVGGEGDAGGNGGNGLGGGIYEVALSTLTLLGVTVEHNRAVGGAAGDGGSDGLGIGGGLYLTPSGIACADSLTDIDGNHATTSDDDVFGTLGSCAPGIPGRTRENDDGTRFEELAPKGPLDLLAFADRLGEHLDT
jgi:hypothetical protein